MNPTAHSVSIAFLAVAAAGAIVLVMVLVALQRRLRIFTRGTVGFMATVLVITTVISTIDLLNDVKIAEQRAKRTAHRNRVVSFLRSTLTAAHPDDTIILVAAGSSNADRIEKDLSEARATIAEASGCRPEELQLIALDVASTSDWTWRHPTSRRWNFEALVSGAGPVDPLTDLVFIKGSVFTSDDENPMWDVVAVDVVEASRPDDPGVTAALYHRADFKAPGFAVEQTGRGTRRKRYFAWR